MFDPTREEREKTYSDFFNHSFKREALFRECLRFIEVTVVAQEPMYTHFPDIVKQSYTVRWELRFKNHSKTVSITTPHIDIETAKEVVRDAIEDSKKDFAYYIVEKYMSINP